MKNIIPVKQIKTRKNENAPRNHYRHCNERYCGNCLYAAGKVINF